jgi:hypothetical protein
MRLTTCRCLLLPLEHLEAALLFPPLLNLRKKKSFLRRLKVQPNLLLPKEIAKRGRRGKNKKRVQSRDPKPYRAAPYMPTKSKVRVPNRKPRPPLQTV